MQKKVSLLTLVVSIVLAIVITFTFTFSVVQTANYIFNYFNDNQSSSAGVDEYQSALPEDKQNPELFETLAMIDYFYQTGYVNDIDKDELVYNLMNAYIICVGDPYGAYYSPEEVDSIFSDAEGVSVGIGVYVKQFNEGDEGIKILEVMNGSPAEKAGLKKGDIITHVDGESVKELGYDASVAKIAGEAGTDVVITALRDGIGRNFKVIRNQFETQSVFYHKYALDNKVGVVRIIEFNDGTPKQFKNAVNSLLDDGCESLVFDVRSNPGGTLASCVEMLDFLLPSGKIVDITDLDGTVVNSYYSSSSQIDVPMAVLTDGGTASAGELFTCALKDYNKAIIVGTNTYGKGCMQNIITLPNGGALRYTTQMYNPPKSDNYDGVGIAPDIKVELDSSLENMNYFEITDAQDNQLSTAYDALKSTR
ncbi:MAG: S41 family peptidase [Clostridia bacterium]|nr:S41 family peptidase [Clostridia bacterium]